jgi:hypothetical protein
MLRILRSPPIDGRSAVEFRLDDRANLIGVDRGGHEVGLRRVALSHPRVVGSSPESW